MSLCLAAAIVPLAACSTGDGREMQVPADPQLPTIGTPAPRPDDDDGDGWTLTTPWSGTGAIDERFTCDGLSVSPPMVWNEGPEMTRAYGVSMTNSAGEILWVMADLDVSIRNLIEGATPEGATVGVNSFGAIGYQAPCPDIAQSDTFTVVVHAQEFPTELTSPADGAELLRALEDSAIDQEISTFTYQRK